MVGRFGCSAGRPSFHRALATATPMVMSENNVIWSCRVDLVARSFQCASACRPKSSLYLLRVHKRRRQPTRWRATRVDVVQPVVRQESGVVRFSRYWRSFWLIDEVRQVLAQAGKESRRALNNNQWRQGGLPLRPRTTIIAPFAAAPDRSCETPGPAE